MASPARRTFIASPISRPISRAARSSLLVCRLHILGGARSQWNAATCDRAAGDRLTQSRSPYYAGQQILANKQIRWWWNNTHQAVYDAGDGAGGPHGPHTEWVSKSKSVGFLEYGFPTSDHGTNQANVFFDPQSTAGGAPFWSIWNPGKAAPLIDATLALTALQAV